MRSAIFVLVMGLVASPAGHARADPWLSFQATPQLILGAAVEVDVDSAFDGHQFWLAKIIRHKQSGDVVQWASSRSCPALLPSLAALGSLEALVIEPPDAPFDPQEHSVLDGTTFELHAHGHFPSEHARGEITLTGNFDTPLGKWVNATLDAIEPCWGDQAPATARR